MGRLISLQMVRTKFNERPFIVHNFPSLSSVG